MATDFFGGWGGAIVGLFRSFGSTSGYTGWVIEALRTGIIELARRLKDGIWLVARYLAKALVEMRKLWTAVLRPMLTWAVKKVQFLEAWLKTHVAPILAFIKRLKEEFDRIYTTYVKPIIDAIEMVRQLNRVLELFHIHVLNKVDEVLAQIERKIEDPFLWVRAKITWVENWIDRIVTFDGLFQRVTLLASMAKHAPEWLNIGANFRNQPITSAGRSALARGTAIADAPGLLRDATNYMQGGRSDFGDVIDAAVQRSTSLYRELS